VARVGVAESVVEEAALGWLGEIGWQIAHGPDVEPEKLGAERDDFSDVVLARCLTANLERINPHLPAAAIDQAVAAVLRVEHPSLIENNRRVHRLLVDGIDVEVRQSDGSTRGDKAWLVDFEHPETNDFLAINQFTVIEDKHHRRPDVVLFVNGLPLGVMELKSPSDEKATAHTAFKQFQTYKQEIPSLFVSNELLVVSDGMVTRAGTLTAEWERFAPWRTIDGDGVEPPATPGLETLVRGMLDPARLLDLIRHFVVFEDDGAAISKKMAAYHQFWAVNKAVSETVRAVDESGDRRIGVVWHTQGSGKSLSMAFYAGKIVVQPELKNPTIVVITDRNDLDDQLYGTFCGCHELLRQTPEQADSRDDLRVKLQVASGGVVFTTIQKFLAEPGEPHPLLSNRRNIVVIADEAHRSQYDFIRGFARNMRDALPNASFIGFTGTPIELTDRNTRAVFGNYVDTYDIERAVQDGATVPIYYEARLQKIELDESERPRIDPDFEEVTEAEELEKREKLKSKWARLEALVGAEKRIKLIAADLVKHFEERLEAMDGKAMVVCMSRRICVEMYDAIAALRPEWASDDDATGVMKVVMTGSASDKLEWQRHIRNKPRREALANRFKDPADPFKVVIVRDMWLTGFDAPCLHTMYVDKPMRGHGLMQAIARVNRVFRDKPGGLVVDYIGLADQLKRAIADYTGSGGAGNVAIDQAAAVAVMLEKYEIACDIMFGFDFTPVRGHMKPSARLAFVAEGMEHVLEQKDGKRRFMDAVSQLSKAFALAVPHDETLRIRDDVGFFQTVRAGLAKLDAGEGAKTDEELDAAVRQIVSRAVVPEGLAYILDIKGGEQKDISILDDGFLAEIRGMKRRNLAVELLNKLMSDDIKMRSRRNLVEARSFSEMLAHTVDEYNNRTITAEDAIEKLIELARRIKAARERGEMLGLNEDELAFYDALETNDSAVQLMGDEVLRKIAQELVMKVRANASVDWSVRESSRARMRLAVKKLLRKYRYPPDKQEKATQTVLEQAELLGGEWADTGSTG
jgi:type I restriction enzyme R subunit